MSLLKIAVLGNLAVVLTAALMLAEPESRNVKTWAFLLAIAALNAAIYAGHRLRSRWANAAGKRKGSVLAAMVGLLWIMLGVRYAFQALENSSGLASAGFYFFFGACFFALAWKNLRERGKPPATR
jgi:small neutral amino acid transporter SnatA (MarC family)